MGFPWYPIIFSPSKVKIILAVGDYVWIWIWPSRFSLLSICPRFLEKFGKSKSRFIKTVPRTR